METRNRLTVTSEEGEGDAMERRGGTSPGTGMNDSQAWADNRAGADCGSGGGEVAGRRRAKGKNWNSCNRITVKK